MMEPIVRNQKSKNGLLPTPPSPHLDTKLIFSENSKKILERRFLRKDSHGVPVETMEEMFWRVAYHVAKVEEMWGGNIEQRTRDYYSLLTQKKFFPNSPTFTGAGTALGQLAACFVLPISDDMGKDLDGIFQTLRDAALIQQTGGGNGFSFSRLRPRGTLVTASAGQASGPVGFLKVYDKAFGEIAQGGTRRGANMAVLRVDHPDIEEFISCKTDENAITNFNISVGVTDNFMRAVKADDFWELCFPDVLSEQYRRFSGTIEDAVKAGIPLITHKRVRAKQLFRKIVRQAHHNGEPGILFLDTANRANPVPHLYHLEATNPCGEQWLGPYENCCLGSINLVEHLGERYPVDWDSLQDSVVRSIRFLDDVIDANAYVPAIPQLQSAALEARRVGLGIMGLADLLYNAQIRYGSQEGLEFSSQVMEFIRYHSMLASIELAKERGPFPAIEHSIYDQEKITWEPPKSIVEYVNDWGRPEVNWQSVVDGIKNHGLRNAAQTTIAPTGTIATVAGCEGYGCEPVYALAYTRHVHGQDENLKLNYLSPLFQNALLNAGFDDELCERITDRILREGSCQHIPEVPAQLKEVFVVSSDIPATDQVRMQAALQAFVDNSLSKTINFPGKATEDDVASTYIQAWELGCKGITVYITGSREKEVLETRKDSKEAIETKSTDTIVQWTTGKKPRPKRLHGFTYRINTPLGIAYITINENGDNQPFEVFINTAKAGSNTAAVSEAIGRLISFNLRVASTISPRQRLIELIHQLEAIGGGYPQGFGPNRVRSLPDGVAQALAEYLAETQPTVISEAHTDGNGKNGTSNHQMATFSANSTSNIQIGDICPECGEASMIFEEGCSKCYSCGFSEC